jgi:hypothetical protein
MTPAAKQLKVYDLRPLMIKLCGVVDLVAF